MTPPNTFIPSMAANMVFDRTGEGFLRFVGSNSTQKTETSRTRDFNSYEPEAHANIPYWQLPMPPFYDPTSFGFENVFYPTETASAGGTSILPELTAADKPAWHERESTIPNQHPTSTSLAGSTGPSRESAVVDFEEPSGPLYHTEFESGDDRTIQGPMGIRVETQRGARSGNSSCGGR